MTSTRFTQYAVFVALLLTLACTAAPQPAAAEQPPGSEQQSEFIPIDQLPPQEQLAAGPLLVGAYVFVIVALFLYLLSLARRLSVVQREVERLEADMKRTAR